MMLSLYGFIFLLLSLSTYCALGNPTSGQSQHEGTDVKAIESFIQNIIRTDRLNYAPPTLERRFLKQEQEGKFCNDDGTVDFTNEDSFNEQALKSAFSPMCSCVERDNSNRVMGVLDHWLGNGTPLSIVGERANDVIGTISGEKSYECINGCEFCFASTGETPKKCGVYESTYKYTYQVSDSNAILEHIKAGDNLEKALAGSGQYMHSDFFFDFCFLHTVGAEGRVCFGTNPRGMTETQEALDECFVSHDGKLCSSCTRGGPNATDASCFQANCTNVEGGGMIDSCEKETMNGPFEILGHYQARTVKLTRGACGDIAKVGNHPTTAPKDEGDAGYTETLVRVERVPSMAADIVTSVWLVLGMCALSSVTAI